MTLQLTDIDQFVLSNCRLCCIYQRFNGNKDKGSVVHHWLKPHFHARFVRFVPLSWVGQRCMRVEIHGCKDEVLPIETLKGNLTKGEESCKRLQWGKESRNKFLE